MTRDVSNRTLVDAYSLFVSSIESNKARQNQMALWLVENGFWKCSPDSACSRMSKCLSEKEDHASFSLNVGEYFALSLAFDLPDFVVWWVEKLGYEVRRLNPAEFAGREIQRAAEALESVSAMMEQLESARSNLKDIVGRARQQMQERDRVRWSR